MIRIKPCLVPISVFLHLLIILQNKLPLRLLSINIKILFVEMLKYQKIQAQQRSVIKQALDWIKYGPQFRSVAQSKNKQKRSNVSRELWNTYLYVKAVPFCYFLILGKTTDFKTFVIPFLYMVIVDNIMYTPARTYFQFKHSSKGKVQQIKEQSRVKILKMKQNTKSGVEKIIEKGKAIANKNYSDLKQQTTMGYDETVQQQSKLSLKQKLKLIVVARNKWLEAVNRQKEAQTYFKPQKQQEIILQKGQIFQQSLFFTFALLSLKGVSALLKFRKR